MDDAQQVQRERDRLQLEFERIQGWTNMLRVTNAAIAGFILGFLAAHNIL